MSDSGGDDNEILLFQRSGDWIQGRKICLIWNVNLL